MALAFAPYGKELIIKNINADDKIKRHLSNLGLNIGIVVKTVTGNCGDVIIKIKDGKFALNRALAMKITVI